MNVEFIDTNVLLYAHDRNASHKRPLAHQLLSRLVQERTGALSTQVFVEFYSAATRKMGLSGELAEEIVRELGHWTIHRPSHSDLLQSMKLQRRYKISWWDAMIVNSAIESGAGILWSEDLADGQRFGSVVVKNPFA